MQWLTVAEGLSFSQKEIKYKNRPDGPLRNTFISTTTANRSILNLLSCYVETAFSRQSLSLRIVNLINNDWFPACYKVKQHSLEYNWINDYNNNLAAKVKVWIFTASTMAAMTGLMLTGWMDITLAFKAHPDTQRNVSPVLVLSVLNRRHFDYWADFHIDSATMFAYLKKRVGRLVNSHQSSYGRCHHIFLCMSSSLHRWSGVHDVSSSACDTSEEFARHQMNLSTRVLHIFHKPPSPAMEGTNWNLEYDTSADENVVLQRGRALFKGKRLKGKSKVGNQSKQSVLLNHSLAAPVLKPMALEWWMRYTFYGLFSL